MTKPGPLDPSSLTDAELVAELARRRASAIREGDMTSMELAAEKAKEELGAAIAFQALDERCSHEDGKPTRCPKCGCAARVEEKKRPRTVRTLSGEQTYRRHYFRCSGCRHGFAPVDDQLGIPADGTVSAEVEKRIADFGVNDVFEQAAERFSMHYGWSISENMVRRVVERIADVLDSLPEAAVQKALLTPSTTPARLLTIGIDGSMLSTREGWQETKVGVIVRDEHHVEGTPTRRGVVTSARYVTASSVDDLRDRLRPAAEAAGIETAERVAIVSDGAPWIRNLCDELFPEAIHVLDWPHVVEHLTDCGKALLGERAPLLATWVRTTTMLVWSGRGDTLLVELRALLDMSDVARAPLDALVRYIENNLARIDYPRFRKLGLPIGSGVVESAHKHVLQVRMKRAGQHWSPSRCRRMARLRAAHRTGGPHFATRLRAARRAITGI
jgi:hypothetical protein